MKAQREASPMEIISRSTNLHHLPFGQLWELEENTYLRELPLLYKENPGISPKTSATERNTSRPDKGGSSPKLAKEHGVPHDVRSTDEYYSDFRLYRAPSSCQNTTIFNWANFWGALKLFKRISLAASQQPTKWAKDATANGPAEFANQSSPSSNLREGIVNKWDEKWHKRWLPKGRKKDKIIWKPSDSPYHTIGSDLKKMKLPWRHLHGNLSPSYREMPTQWTIPSSKESLLRPTK